MKLDYLADGSPNCPLLRLYDFTPVEAGRLRAAVSELANEVTGEVDVHRLPFVDAVDEIRLTLVRMSRELGLSRVASQEFECGFTANTWDNVAGLIEPFATSAQGFQWLVELPGETGLLLSASGQW
jgi:hypothetical protein